MFGHFQTTLTPSLQLRHNKGFESYECAALDVIQCRGCLGANRWGSCCMCGGRYAKHHYVFISLYQHTSIWQKQEKVAVLVKPAAPARLVIHRAKTHTNNMYFLVRDVVRTTFWSFITSMMGNIGVRYRCRAGCYPVRRHVGC